MGVWLDYALYPGDLPRLSSADLRTVDRDELNYYFFAADILFEIARDDELAHSTHVPLLEFTRDDYVEVRRASFSVRWSWGFVLDFVSQLYEITCSIQDAETRHLDFTESEVVISFKRSGEFIEIEADYTPDRARVRLTMLREAARSFFIRVVADLSAGWPELLENPAFLEIRAELDREVTNA